MNNGDIRIGLWAYASPRDEDDLLYIIRNYVYLVVILVYILIDFRFTCCVVDNTISQVSMAIAFLLMSIVFSCVFLNDMIWKPVLTIYKYTFAFICWVKYRFFSTPLPKKKDVDVYIFRPTNDRFYSNRVKIASNILVVVVWIVYLTAAILSDINHSFIATMMLNPMIILIVATTKNNIWLNIVNSFFGI
jgi:hypothetical protein